MPLTRVTITGADNSTNVDSLLDVAWYYPFAELGILFGKEEKLGTARFPTHAWIKNLITDIGESFGDFQLSGHLCFPWIRNLTQNGLNWDEIGLLSNFDRIQINQSYHDADPAFVRTLLLSINNINKPVIFQNNGTLPVQSVLDYVPDATMGSTTEPQILFDCSGGRGVEIRSYPEQINGFHCGYAGGIGPENIERVLKDLEAKFPDMDYWIDMESKVRTDNVLDLEKVETCLKIAKEFIDDERIV